MEECVPLTPQVVPFPHSVAVDNALAVLTSSHSAIKNKEHLKARVKLCIINIIIVVCYKSLSCALYSLLVYTQYWSSLATDVQAY